MKSHNEVSRNMIMDFFYKAYMKQIPYRTIRRVMKEESWNIIGGIFRLRTIFDGKEAQDVRSES